MPKAKSKFLCQQCGYESPKWLGKCPGCGGWNTLVEELVEDAGRYAARQTLDGAGLGAPAPKRLSEVGYETDVRIPTGNRELDRVLGGGLVQGSLVLVGGDPGIGKSTLLLQICQSLGQTHTVLYVSGEESASQIKIRADRLGITAENLLLLPETNLDNAVFQASSVKPDVLIVDSIQTMFRPEVSSAPGSVSQVRETTHVLMRLAKEQGVAVFIVGHVTKEGSIAGPRMLEHMVDCVLYFEGERQQSYRVLRTVKNRFGSTNEIGVFEMKDTGLSEVPNPSEMLLSGRPKDTPGSTVVCTLEGTRPVLAEVQALSSPTGFGMARRMATGLDYNRAVLLVAILEKKLGYSMQNQDVYINVVGGIRIVETATDLAVVLAIASNYHNFVIPPDTIILGEVGLTGEVRAISYAERRVMEAKKMGFSRCMVPEGNVRALASVKGIAIAGVGTVRDAIRIITKDAKKGDSNV